MHSMTQPAPLPLLVRCARCGESKDPSEFYAHPKNPTGCQSRCKACIKARNVERRAEIIEYNRQHRWEDQRVRMASDARRRDRAAHRASDIEAKDIFIPEFCPVTGEPMWHSVDGPAPWSPCLVRIDKTCGYVRGNWKVISSNALVLESEPTGMLVR
ncbi:hypothetical protein A8M77_29990 [Variovorax sp. JS1663]|nr:hypothetical protein A8M77_29990 [Variovorax sp. JS1663]